jgi:hypothetical protein
MQDLGDVAEIFANLIRCKWQTRGDDCCAEKERCADLTRFGNILSDFTFDQQAERNLLTALLRVSRRG